MKDMPKGISPLDLETRSHVSTAEAAAYLHRRPATLYFWTNRQAGAVLPVKVHGRLLWPVASIKRVMEIR